MIAALLLLHAVVGLTVLATGDRWGRRAFLAVAAVPAITVLWVAARLGDVVDGRPVEESYGWVESLGLRIDLRVDAFSALMVLLVAGIGVLVCAYAWSYFSTDKPGTGRLAALICLFAGAMTGVVVSDHLLALFVFWELTSVTSYLLIGNSDRSPVARAAALQALLITGSGGLAMLFGFVVVGQSLGTYRISEIVTIAPPADDGWFLVGLVCVLVGAFAKSAQAPLGSWLPGAMVAPTPISAYLHSATMVKAGVYLVARFAPAWAGSGPWTHLIVAVGLTTMILGGLRALRQDDLKLLLAFGTTSQLGFLIVLFGLGLPGVTQAGVAMLLAHALFKAPLFMVVGMIDHEVGTRDVRRLRGFGRGWRPVLTVAVVSACSMAGIPPLLGFIGKEKALDALHDAGTTATTIGFVGIVVGSIFTVAYSARFVLGILGRLHSTGEDGAVTDSRTVHAPAATFVWPAALLTVVTVVSGVVPAVVDSLVAAATLSIDPAKEPAHLALWHGVNIALLSSIVIVALGLVLVALRDRVAPVLALGSRVPSSDAVYRRLLGGSTTLARAVTRVVQHGSLPLYASVILLTISVVPTVALLASGAVPGLPQWVEAPVEIPLVGMVLASGLGAALITRRFAAAVVLGAVGYAMSGVYVLLGAIDLALTQFAIETLSVVVFMLTLRHLPDRHESRPGRVLGIVRVAVALAVASFVFLFAVTAGSLRTERPVSDEMIARAGPEAKGENVVNVIIVDFRGLDTLGEIAVLMVSVLGAIGLVRPDRLGRRSSATPTAAPTAVDEVMA